MAYPLFLKNDLIKWVKKQNQLQKLFSDWANSGYNQEFTPSINRIDDFEGYEFSNMELTTWQDNKQKGWQSKKTNEARAKTAKTLLAIPVIHKDTEGNILGIYPSINEASRLLGLNPVAISRVCRKLKSTYKGSYWEYLKRY